MATTMSPEQRRAFLLHGTRTGTLATTRADGRPHAAPVWFTLDGDDVVFLTGADTVKGRNLRRAPRATLSVDDDAFPYGFVVIEGDCDLSDDPDTLRRWSQRIAARYVPAAQVDAYAARNAVPGELCVRLRPRNVVAMAAVAH